MTTTNNNKTDNIKRVRIKDKRVTCLFCLVYALYNKTNKSKEIEYYCGASYKACKPC